MKPHRFHRAARSEYVEAVRWYRERSEEAAVDLAHLVRSSIAEIEELPLAWPRWPERTDLRVRTLRRFPYSIVYCVGTEIVILAVAHQRRRPGYWLPRAPGSSTPKGG